MYKIEDVKIIERLLNEDKIATLNARGRIRFESDLDIIVDDLNEPKGFILTSDYWNVVYSIDDKIAERKLGNIEFRQNRGFAGVLTKYYDVVKVNNDIDWCDPCYLYYMNKEDLDVSKIKHDVKELRLEDAEIVNEFYTYKGEYSLEFIRDCIRNRPTSAIFNEEGNPISWAVVKEDGSMGIMYTRKEYRGKDLAKSVSIDLAKKVFDINWIPYVHIIVENTPSINLAESTGFSKYGKVIWFGVKERR